MIVVDASVLAAVLIDADAPATDEAIGVLQADPHWVVPEHAMIETVNAIRGRALVGGQVELASVPGIVQSLVELSLDHARHARPPPGCRSRHPMRCASSRSGLLTCRQDARMHEFVDLESPLAARRRGRGV